MSDYCYDYSLVSPNKILDKIAEESFYTKNEKYEVVTVFDIPMLFTCERIDHKTIPEELFVYEVRHDDDCQGIPCEINKYIFVNHWGTLISNRPFPTVENGKPVFLDEDDWNYDGYDMTLADYIKITEEDENDA